MGQLPVVLDKVREHGCYASQSGFAFRIKEHRIKKLKAPLLNGDFSITSCEVPPSYLDLSKCIQKTGQLLSQSLLLLLENSC